jgi:SET domain-containing protein
MRNAPGGASRGAGDGAGTGRRAGRWFSLRPSPIQGRGAFASRFIPRGTRIIEYTGERITHEEADARYDDGSMARHHTWLFTVNGRLVVDAAVGGNASRFINHSCEPNCAIEIERERIYIDAARDIAPGEELTYDYAYEREAGDDERAERHYLCRCGARRCRGTILVPES